MQETQFQSLGWKDSLEEEMTIHSSILARKIHATPGRFFPKIFTYFIVKMHMLMLMKQAYQLGF